MRRGKRAQHSQLQTRGDAAAHQGRRADPEFSPDCLAAPANKPFTIRLTNLDKSSHGQHNIEIEDVFEGEVIDGEGKSITYELGPLRAGKYKFVDSQHTFMGGTLVVKKSPPRTVTD